MFNDSLKARAINYLKYSSLYTDKNLINCRFKTYKTVDTETKLAFEIANRATTEILLNKPIHMILSGKSGVGKSHLAMSTAGKCWRNQTMINAACSLAMRNS